jgi:hypothetical protein
MGLHVLRFVLVAWLAHFWCVSAGVSESTKTLTAMQKNAFEGMITSPIARLYTKENYKGEFEDYKFAKSKYGGGCHDVKLKGKINSVETYGKCVRLFTGPLCGGLSLAVYPGSERNDLQIFVASIGPCLPNEFQYSSLKGSTKRDIQKGTADVPDMVEFMSAKKMLKSTQAVGVHKATTHYLLGTNGRLEFLLGFLYARTLAASGSSTRVKVHNVELGYGIPPYLGGPTDVRINAFPQSLSSNREWERVTSAIRPFLEKNPSKGVLLALNFEYADEKQTRPNAFYYYIHYEGELVTYGRVLNS